MARDIEQQRTLGVDARKAAVDWAVAGIHAHAFPYRMSALKPSLSDRGKTFSFGPDPDPMVERGTDVLEQNVRGRNAAVRLEMRHGPAEIVRMANKVETDTDDRRETARRLIGVRYGAAFDQDAAGLGAINENVIRPFKAYSVSEAN